MTGNHENIEIAVIIDIGTKHLLDVSALLKYVGIHPGLAITAVLIRKQEHTVL